MTQSWSRTTLAEACQIKPPKKMAKQTLSDADSVSFVPMDQLGIYTKAIDTDGTRPLAEVYGSYTYFAENDVLLAKITPCFENGKLGIARGLENGVGFGSSEFVVFRCRKKIDPEYLFYFLSQDRFRDAGSKVMTGAVGHKRVPKDFIERYEIPLPLLPEQRRIVAILDEAFQGIDRAVANTEKNLANARELFESYLDAVLSANDGQTSKLNSAIVAQDDVVREGWRKLQVRKVLKLEYGKPLPKEDRSANGEFPAYGANGIKCRTDRIYFDRPSIIVGRKGSAGEVTLADGPFWPLDVTYFVTYDDRQHDLKFLYHLLKSLELPKLADGVKPGINRNRVYNLEAAFPPLPEQKRIVAILDELKANSTGLVCAARRKLDLLAGLKQSILHKAFAGELTADRAEPVLAEAGA